MTQPTSELRFTAELFAWNEEGSWYFVRLPVQIAEEVRDRVTAPPRGFGSVRVDVLVGSTRWTTSVFPEKETSSFVLPVKKQVRRAEDLEDGDPVTVTLTVVD